MSGADGEVPDLDWEELVEAMVDTIGQHGYEFVDDGQLAEIKRLLTPFFRPRVVVGVAR